MPGVLQNSKVPKSLERVEWFGWLFACSYQHFVRYSLKLQNMFFLGWHCQHRLSANQTVKCFMLNKSENYVKCHVGFLLPLKLQNICYFGLWPQNTLGQSICRMFYIWLVKLNTGGPLLHCTYYFLFHSNYFIFTN